MAQLLKSQAFVMMLIFAGIGSKSKLFVGKFGRKPADKKPADRKELLQE
jgi:hypothetical protein